MTGGPLGEFVVRKFAVISWALLAAVTAALLLPAMAAAQETAPKFQPEPFWPKPLPENWILGQVAGIAVDPQDNIWIIHRPASLLDDEKGARKIRPRPNAAGRPRRC